MNRAAEFLATLGGIGRAPFAPGTVASLVALPFAWIIQRYGGEWLLILLTLSVTAIGIVACGHVANLTNDPDPSACVIDELAGQWLTCAFAPPSILGYALAFLLFRLFDIAKPWPISSFERLAGGLGIMADDLAAAVMGGVLIAGASVAGLV